MTMRWLMLLIAITACTHDDAKPTTRCADGSTMYGAPPPKGKGTWCEQKLEGGRFVITRTDRTKWVEGAMAGRDRNGTWTWYAPDGSVAAVRQYIAGEMTSEKVTDPSIKTPGE